MRYLVYVFVLFIVLSHWNVGDANAQRNRSGRFGGSYQEKEIVERMQAVNTFRVERIWYYLGIRMDTTDEQVLQLRIVLKEILSKRDKLFEQAEITEDWGWLRVRLEASQEQFKGALTGILSSEEMKTLETLQKEGELRRRRSPRRFRR